MAKATLRVGGYCKAGLGKRRHLIESDADIYQHTRGDGRVMRRCHQCQVDAMRAWRRREAARVVHCWVCGYKTGRQRVVEMPGYGTTHRRCQRELARLTRAYRALAWPSGRRAEPTCPQGHPYTVQSAGLRLSLKRGYVTVYLECLSCHAARLRGARAAQKRAIAAEIRQIAAQVAA